MPKQHLEKVKKYDCSVLNEIQLNTLLTYNNLVISKENYEKSLKLIKKKYFSTKVTSGTKLDVVMEKYATDLNDVSSSEIFDTTRMFLDDLVKAKWKRIVKKYTGFNVTLRNSVFENLSHILIIEREKE